MNITEAQEKFIQAWGTLGQQWGVNRTMAQIQALLLVAPEPLHAEEIMERLSISRGNANMNVRALIDWGIAYKEHKSGERKEYFRAEKDIWEVAKRVTLERRKRELEPIVKLLDEVKQITGDKNDPEIKEFELMVDRLDKFANKVDKSLEYVIRADEHWFLSTFMKAFKG
ncbi:MAG: transcriptional regulator [Crocinitomicaceae bacterium]|nr:transcriptional regulator [Crocinitomicaceae bacterium]|tara:strand:- start:815 stop:1324 length:510 start_codon:yes stop_codon:yes gene_type:complete